MWLWGLSLFHVCFFRRFYFQNWYINARGEPLEWEFPASRLLGEQLRQNFWLTKVDDSYYLSDYTGLPYTASFYPPHRLQAWLGSFLSLNQAWVLFNLMMVSHFWLASVSVYILARSMGVAPWSAGFVSLTLSYLPYAVKQNNCIVYTLAWIPTLLFSAMTHQITTFSVSLGMMLLAGYWPLALPALWLGCLAWLCF